VQASSAVLSATALVRVSQSKASWLASPLLRPFNEPALWQALARSVNPLYHPRDFGARVVRVVDEAPQVKSFYLQCNQRAPGRRWNGHSPGQHVAITVAINGRLQTRAFSISNANSETGLLRLTVKLNAASAHRLSVSAWMHANLKVGAKLSVTAPSGNFSLPSSSAKPAQKLGEKPSEKPILLLSAGSGITPVMAMLEALTRRNLAQPVLFVHISKNAGDLIFADALAGLQQAHPMLALKLHFSERDGRFDPSSLANLITQSGLQAASFDAFICGPSGFSKTCEAVLSAAGVTEIQKEHFGGAPASTDQASCQHEISFNLTKQLFTVASHNALLPALEAQGSNPAFGCRIGICKTCQCLKRSGTTLNLQTGVQSDAPNEWITLCVNAAMSPLTLAL